MPTRPAGHRAPERPSRRTRRRAKRKLARLHFASSERDADILYPTRFLAPDPFLFVQVGRQRLIVVSDLELDRARAQATAGRVLAWSAYVRRVEARGQPPHTAAVIAAVLRDLGVSRAEVPEGFPLGLGRALGRRGVRLRVAHDPFWRARETKRPAEVRAIVAALRAAEAGIQAGIEALRAARPARNGFLRHGGGLFTAEQLRAIVNSAVLSRGADPAHTICAPGDQAVDPHEAGHGPLRAQEPIVIDVFPRSQTNGYFGDVTRTVVRGRASERLRAAYAAVGDAVRLAQRRVRPGAHGQAIHGEVVALFERRGFRTGESAGRVQGFFHGTGHGVGLELHEAPYISARRPARLRPGHVVTVEPGLYYLGVGGVRIEDLLVVTRTGSRNLTRLPKLLEI